MPRRTVRLGHTFSMICNTELILAYIDGELSPEDAARVRAHTAACAACRAILQSEQELDAALGGLNQFAPPPEFASATVRRAQCDVGHALRSPRERKVAFLVAGGLAALSLVLLWPTGIGATMLGRLAPLRCMGRFALGWVESTGLSIFIVSRTVSRGLLSAAHLPLTGVLILLGLLVLMLAWMLAGYRDRHAEATRDRMQ